MSDEKNISVEDTELMKINKIKISLEKLKTKKSKFLFIIPESNAPAVSTYEVYFHATVIKNLGYNVIILTEKGDYVVPTWIEKELTDHKHITMTDSKLTVGPEDIMIIPEMYSNVMEQTKNLPCLRIGLLQSIDYMVNSLIPGIDWSSFGISDVITTSETLKELVETYYGEDKFNINYYNIGIPDYFSKGNKPKKPIISVVGRNSNEISKFVKLFFNKYPQYNWVTFDPMVTKSKPPQPMRRIDFAKRLGENFAAVWIDRISSFGTFPLECMKTGTVPICLRPDIIPDYMIIRNEDNEAIGVNNDAGMWTENYYDLPMMVGNLINKFLDDSIPTEIYDKMDNVVAKYNQIDSENQLIELYSKFIDDRIKLLESAVNPTK